MRLCPGRGARGLGGATPRCPGTPLPHSRAQTTKSPCLARGPGWHPAQAFPPLLRLLSLRCLCILGPGVQRGLPALFSSDKLCWNRGEGKGRVSARTFHLGSGKPAIFKMQEDHPQVSITVPTTPRIHRWETWSPSPGTICLEGRRLLMEGFLTASLAAYLGQIEKETSPRLPTHCAPQAA